MINPMEKGREGSTAECKTLPYSVALAEKTIQPPQHFSLMEVNPNLNPSEVNDMSWKINLQTSGWNDPHLSLSLDNLWPVNMYRVLKLLISKINLTCTRSHQAHTEREPCRAQQKKKTLESIQTSALYVCSRRGCNKPGFLFASLCAVFVHQQAGEGQRIEAVLCVCITLLRLKGGDISRF